MRKLNIPTLAGKIAACGQISAQDVAVLRLHLFDGHEIWPQEARAMFDLLHKRLPACAEWESFFVELMSHYVVDQLEPRGAVDEKNARWLIAMIRREGAMLGGAELSLLVAVMEKAGAAPIALQHFSLEMLQLAMGCVKADASDLAAAGSSAVVDIHVFGKAIDAGTDEDMADISRVFAICDTAVGGGRAA